MSWKGEVIMILFITLQGVLQGIDKIDIMATDG